MTAKGGTLSPEARAKLSRALKGRIISSETRARMSASRMGHVISAETRAKIAASHIGLRPNAATIEKLRTSHIGKTRTTEQEAHRVATLARGERHWNWKGGLPRNHRHTKPYYEWKRAVHERDEFACTQCGKWPLAGRDLQADHIAAWADHPEYRYLVLLGRTLCLACHRARSGRQQALRINRKKAA